MRKPTSEFTLLLSGILLLGGCAGTSTPPQAAPETGSTERAPAGRPETASPESPRDDALAAALERAIADSGEWPSLRLFTECRRDGGLESVEIHGNGVAIWDNRLQFEVSGAEISTLLTALEAADFAGMPETFGGKVKPEDPKVPPRPSDGEGAIFALRVICRVELSVGGRTKRVAQLDEGKQSAELKELSEEFFRVCAEPARRGVGASDLTDGLGKIGRGELAPEVFRLMLHRRPSPNEPISSEGFLLRLEGREATSRLVEANGRHGSAMALVLSPEEVSELARDLAGLDVESLPINLYAIEYTDLTIEVLNRDRSVQARQFAGMDPATHGDAQRRFEALFEGLFELHRRVMADGSAIPD